MASAAEVGQGRTSVGSAARRLFTGSTLGARPASWLDREGVLGYVLMTPALLLLIVFIAYPFVLGIWYSLSDLRIFGRGAFIGLKNYENLLQSPVFLQAVHNSFVYTGTATVF